MHLCVRWMWASAPLRVPDLGLCTCVCVCRMWASAPLCVPDVGPFACACRLYMCTFARTQAGSGSVGSVQDPCLRPSMLSTRPFASGCAQVGDSFVLNVLSEDNYNSIMKHFLKRFAPGAGGILHPSSFCCVIVRQHFGII